MKTTRRFLRSFALVLLLGMFTGCIGYNRVLFMTKSNAGLDFDNKPPTLEINISRKEGVLEPAFDGGKTPPVMASFGNKSGAGGGLGRFFFGVNQTFAGGDAAVTMTKLYNTNGVPSEDASSKTRFDSGLSISKVPKENTQAGKGWLGWKKFLFGLPEPGEVHPFFFGTDSQLGVKVGWNGLGGPYPDNVKIGYSRKEMALAPVTFNPWEDDTHTNMVRIPSFLATVDSDVEVGGDVTVGWMQYFATGESASALARQPGVRQAMHQRADPLSLKKAQEIEIAAKRAPEFVAEQTQKRIGTILDGIKVLPDAKALELETHPPVADPAIDRIVALRDPGNQRATNGSVAREMLKMRAVLSGKRSEPELAAWDAAVKAAQ